MAPTTVHRTYWRRADDQWAPGNDPTPPILMEADTPIVQPAPFLLDSFNAGASQALSVRTGWGTGHWIAGDGDFSTDSGPTFITGAGGPRRSNMWATQQPADQEAYFQFHTSSIDAAYLVLRGNSASAASLTSGYAFIINWDGYAAIADVAENILVDSGPSARYPYPLSPGFTPPASNEQYCFQAIGQTLTAFRKKPNEVFWSPLLRVNSALYNSAGYVGVATYGGATPAITAFGAEPAGQWQDSGTVIVGVVPTASETISDVATVSFSITQTATENVQSGTVSDSGTFTFGITETATEQIQDAGSSIVGVSQTAVQTINEPVALVTIGLSQTASEAIVDSGTQSIVLSPTASEALVDAGLQTFSVTPSGTAEQIRDAGTVVMVFPTPAVETESDAGTVTLGIVATGGETLSDSGTFTVGISASAAETIADAGTSSMTIVIAEVGIEQGLVTIGIVTTATEQIQDAGTFALGVSSTATEVVTDQGTVTFAIVEAALESLVLADAGTFTVGISSSGAETIRDAGTSSLSIAPSSSEQLRDAGTTSAAIAASSSSEQIQDAGTVSFTISEAAASEGIVYADAGTFTIGISNTASETIGDTGTGLVSVGLVVAGAQWIVDAGTVTLSISSTAAVQIQEDPAASAFSLTVDGTASETIRDSGAQTIVLAMSGQDGPAMFGTFTIGISQSYLSGDLGTVNITIAPGSVATEQIRASDTFVFAISGKAQQSSGIDLSSGSPLSQDAGRRLRIKANRVRADARRTGNPWRRDRSIR